MNSKLIYCLFVLLFFSGCGKSRQRLHVFIWPDYLDPKIVADFEREFDCAVTVDFYETVDLMQAKLNAGGAAVYDIVVASDNTLPALVRNGLVAPLRRESIPNRKNIDSRFQNLSFDPDNRFGAPFQWGSDGLYVRVTKGQTVEETWGLMFDPAKQPGPFLLSEDIRSCLGAALLYLHYSVNTTNRAELVEAGKLVMEAKERSLGFASSAASKAQVLSKVATLSHTYSSEGLRGAMEDSETRYFIPREGGGIALDILCVPSHAPHRDLAEKFINYLLDARVGAQLANFTRSATVNKAALEFVRPEDLANPSIYPPPEVMNRLQFAHDLLEMNSLYDELWTRIKSK